MIYVVTTMLSFLVEMICWGLRTRYQGDHMLPDPIGWALNRAITYKFTKAGKTQLRSMLGWWRKYRWTNHVGVILRVLEVGNMIW